MQLVVGHYYGAGQTSSSTTTGISFECIVLTTYGPSYESVMREEETAKARLDAA
jgi:hypothetical protein